MNNMDRCKEREAQIPVSRLHELFYVNPDIGTLIWKAKSGRGVNAHLALQPAGGKSGYGYLRVSIGRPQVPIHRIVFAMHHGRWPDGELDHINRVKTDNRIDNLREATHAENNRNTDRMITNTSGITGVSWCKRDKRWMAYIYVSNVRRYLGNFADIEHAQMVRRIAEHCLWGGIHALNDEPEGELA